MRRLVTEELHTVWIHSDLAAENGTVPKADTPERAARLLPTKAWSEHKETMAHRRALSDDDWVRLSSLMNATEAFRVILLDLEPQAPLGSNLQAAAKTNRDLAAELYESITGSPPWR